MGESVELRRELDRTFVPFVRERGFLPDAKRDRLFWSFRRERNQSIHVFDVQWEKYGAPRFVINFGTCPAEGLTIQGTVHEAKSVLASWLPDRGRLQPGRVGALRSWFRQDKPFVARLLSAQKLRPVSEVSSELIALFEELEAYWSRNEVGPHIHIWSRHGV